MKPLCCSIAALLALTGAACSLTSDRQDAPFLPADAGNNPDLADPPDLDETPDAPDLTPDTSQNNGVEDLQPFDLIDDFEDEGEPPADMLSPDAEPPDVDAEPPDMSADAPDMALTCDSPSQRWTLGCVTPIQIPAGYFMMGSPSYEQGRLDDEEQVAVTLTRALEVWPTELTLGQAVALGLVAPEDLTEFACSALDCPASRVTFYMAAAWANALSKWQGLRPCYLRYFEPLVIYDVTHAQDNDFPAWGDADCEGWRLPTEAEWEYLARAGTTTGYYTGEPTGALCDTALMSAAQHCAEQALPVGSLQPNPWGLYDTLGNLAEWVWDSYGESLPGGADPVSIEETGVRIVRGGSYVSNASRVRAAARTQMAPQMGARAGLRPVRIAPR